MLVIIDPRNGLVPVGANPFLEPMPTSHVLSEQECLIWLATFIICVVAMLVIIDPRNGLMPVGANPLLEPMMTSHVLSKQECLLWLATFIICVVLCDVSQSVRIQIQYTNSTCMIHNAVHYLT